MFFKELNEFTVAKLDNGEFKIDFYGDVENKENLFVLWSQNYKTLYDGLVDLFEGSVYDSTEIIGPLLMGDDVVEISMEDKKDIIENLAEEGRFSLTDAGYVVENISVEVSPLSFAEDGDYIIGSVKVDDVSYPFDYNISTQELELHHYSEPGWLSGSSYEKPLPSVVMRNFDDIDSSVYSEIESFTEKFTKACEYLSGDIDTIEYSDFLQDNAQKAIYVYENKKDFMDLDFWTRYEYLLDEQLTYVEFVAINSDFNYGTEDPFDVEKEDTEQIAHFRASLNTERERSSSLGNRIADATERSSKTDTGVTGKDDIVKG